MPTLKETFQRGALRRGVDTAAEIGGGKLGVGVFWTALSLAAGEGVAYVPVPLNHGAISSPDITLDYANGGVIALGPGVYRIATGVSLTLPGAGDTGLLTVSASVTATDDIIFQDNDPFVTRGLQPFGQYVWVQDVGSYGPRVRRVAPTTAAVHLDVYVEVHRLGDYEPVSYV